MDRLWKRIVSWITLAVATVILWIPIYYFVIGAFKKRTDIVKHPLAIDFSRMSLDNFAYAFKKMNLFKALGNTGFITVIALLIVIVCGSLAGFAIARIRHKIFQTFGAQFVQIHAAEIVNVFFGQWLIGLCSDAF